MRLKLRAQTALHWGTWCAQFPLWAVKTEQAASEKSGLPLRASAPQEQIPIDLRRDLHQAVGKNTAANGKRFCRQKSGRWENLKSFLTRSNQTIFVWVKVHKTPDPNEMDDYLQQRSQSHRRRPQRYQSVYCPSPSIWQSRQSARLVRHTPGIWPEVEPSTSVRRVWWWLF